AADIIKAAMLRVDADLTERGLRSRLLLQVHDELVLEVAAGELDEVRDLVVDRMYSALELDVPLDVSTGTGRDWDSAAHCGAWAALRASSAVRGERPRISPTRGRSRRAAGSTAPTPAPATPATRAR